MSSVLYELLENHDWWCFLCELIATENKLYFTFESSEVVSVFKHSRICCVPSTLPVSPSLHSSSGHRFLFKHNGGSKVTTGYMRVCIKSCHPIKWCLTTLLWRWAPYKGYENILPRFTFTLTEHVKSRWTWKKKDVFILTCCGFLSHGDTTMSHHRYKDEAACDHQAVSNAKNGKMNSDRKWTWEGGRIKC